MSDGNTDGRHFGITPAAWWKRLPLIRHVRWSYHTWKVNEHYEMWARMGMLPLNAGGDYDVLDAIWRGDL